MNKAVDKYLEHYAEALALRLFRAELPQCQFGQCVVVPAYDESPEFVDALLPALSANELPGLLICVVNGPADATPGVADRAEALKHAVEQRFGAGIALAEEAQVVLYSAPEVALLWVAALDLPPRVFARQGVGLARKLGNDVALALWCRGLITRPWFHQADADVELGAEAFAGSAELARRGQQGAAVLPFHHVESGQPDVDLATFKAEVRLRYQVLGMRWAGSPYAWHSIGSCLAVHAQTYAEVRGFPKRAAGEDYHLLAKVQKLRQVYQLSVGRVHIRARRSQRTAFGTGQSVEQLLCERALLLDPMASFAALSRWLERLSAFVDNPAAVLWPERDDAATASFRDAQVVEVLDAMGAFQVLPKLARAAPQRDDRARRLHGWFDGLKSQQFIHELRRRVFPRVSVASALGHSPFSKALDGLLLDSELTLGARQAGEHWWTLCRRLEDLETAVLSSPRNIDGDGGW